MEIIFATGNAHKVAEAQKALGSTITLIMPKELGLTEDIPEDGDTLVANAIQKAEYLWNKFGKNCFADFEKYLLSLIPPELFNLYFFDGEKIADFFMDEGGNSRIKDAFLTLCGYDTFDIMKRNFKRINNSGDSVSVAYEKYEELKAEFDSIKDSCLETEIELQECKAQIEDCAAEISALEKAYSNSGGISEEEWNNKLLALKEEEKRREQLNALLKKWANDVIPFLMIRDKIIAVRSQIEKENQDFKCKSFCEIINSDVVSGVLKSKATIEELKNVVQSYFGSGEEQILDLSTEQSTALLIIINDVLSFEMDNIAKYKRAIKRSISKTTKSNSSWLPM